jgi:hypothetical protein
VGSVTITHLGQGAEYDVMVTSDYHGKLVVGFGWQFIYYRENMVQGCVCIFTYAGPKKLDLLVFGPDSRQHVTANHSGGL